MENYLNENKAYNFCKAYAPQRAWCKENDLDMSELKDEIQFQKYLKEFDFVEKRELVIKDIAVKRRMNTI